MKDAVENRRRIRLGAKLRAIRLVLRQNGLRWSLAFAAYYIASTVAHRAFWQMDRIRRQTGVPGLNSLELNKTIWQAWNWGARGEEWTPSESWKASVVRCFIERYIRPGIVILEIGPGGGRWTEYLLRYASLLFAVDISQSCIDACRRRFSAADNARFLLGSGRDLAQIHTASVDVIWSFDVFVHINEAEVADYILEFDRVLKPGGLGIIHHGSVGGALGGWRSDLTQSAMLRLLRQATFEVLESLQEWTDGESTYRFDLYNDRMTIFKKASVLQAQL